MESGKYYVLADGNNLFEGMTKEQIITAIAEATGSTPTAIDDAFITKIKEQNRNTPLSFWIGTNAEYNSLEEIIPNCFYIFSDTDELADIETLAENAAEEKATELIEAEKARQKLNLYTGTITYGNQNIDIPNIDKYALLEVVTLYENGSDFLRIPVICNVEADEHAFHIYGTGTRFVDSFNPSVIASVYMRGEIFNGIANLDTQKSNYIHFRLAGGGIELYDCGSLSVSSITGIM